MKGENLMNNAHKATNKAYRDNYDAIFNKEKCPHCGEYRIDLSRHFCTLYYNEKDKFKNR